MTEKEKLQEALIKELSKKTESSYSRIYQHTQDDSTFAIIGSEDKDTGEDRSKELGELVRKATYKRGKAIGFNKVDGVYTYETTDGQEKKVAYEKSLILYDVDKQTALDIADGVNQESIVWKDPNFFGVIYVDNGGTMCEFQNEEGNNMNFTGSEDKGFGTKLKNDSRPGYGFTFEGTIKYPETVIKKSPNTKTDDTLEEHFIFYSK